MRSNRRYLVAVALLAALAVAFGVLGTVAPPLAEETGLEPQQESSSESVGHFQNPPTYDSGWVNITAKTGKYITLEHDLNMTNVVVDITGKQSLDPLGGGLAWNKTYGGASFDFAWSVVETRDGGYALAGSTYSFGAGSSDFWLVKTDSAGNMLWNRTYGGASDDEALSMVETRDGGYALAGATKSLGVGSYDFWLVKTDGVGNVLWNRTYGRASSVGAAASLVQTDDGGYALAGYIYSSGAGSADFWLVKVNADMNRIHQMNLGNLENGLAWIGLTNTTITLYRGETDPYWNYVRVRIWLIKEPSWIYGDINMDGIVDNKDLYIVGRNYGKTFSLLSISGIIAVASIHMIRKRKQAN